MRSSRLFSFLNGPNKLVFVHIEESTITGLVEPPYPNCSLVAFCTFVWLRLCVFGAFGAFYALVRAKSFRKKKNK